MTILIVEDEPVSRGLLRAQLSSLGFAVREAADGIEALAALAAGSIDLMVSDVLMPRMDGYRLCYDVRAQARYESLPIVLYTANYVSAEDERVARELGADAFLRKPADLARLQEVIQHLTSRPRVGRPNAAPGDVDKMKLYNERLVAKLEERTRDAERAQDALEDANASLERRVRERTDELERANQQLEAFAYFVSHELRAPLRAIEGFSAMLREEYATSFPEEAQRLFRVIERNTSQMGRLIEDLLRFSRMSREPVRKGPVDMTALVRSVWQDTQERRKATGVDFALGDLPPAWGDEALLRHVWSNLLDNAVKFSARREHPRLEVGGRETADETHYFVRDNGIGFEMAVAGKLFKAFQRLQAEPGFEGSGIGLELVQTVVRRHGGRVWAEGAPDQGATFWFSLPSRRE